MFVQTSGQVGPSLSLRLRPAPDTAPYEVDSEYGRLRSVLLADPRHLSQVPCNSISRDAIACGQTVDRDRAIRQHAMLVSALRSEGVEPVIVPADPGLPDLAFTRDTSLMTPWGLIGLRPGADHRAREVDAVLDAAGAAGVPVFGRIEQGTIEGGDICLLRPGTVVIGRSGERTNDVGARALAEIFQAKGWEVIHYRFDPHYLHLDTMFCMISRNLALAAVDVLEPAFVERMRRSGIDLIPVAHKEMRTLACNLLSLGGKRVITTGTCSRSDAVLAARGYHVIALELDEFIRCGGGVHCLTMPLARDPG